MYVRVCVWCVYVYVYVFVYVYVYVCGAGGVTFVCSIRCFEKVNG
jgi:hypothetical protein